MNYKGMMGLAGMLMLAPIMASVPAEAKVVSKADVVTSKATLIEAMRAKLLAGETDFTIDFQLTLPDGEIEALFDDILAQDEYLHYAVVNEAITVGEHSLHVTLQFIHSMEDEAKLTEAVPVLASQIFRPGMYDIEKLQALQNYMAANYTYGENAQSPYALIKDKKADDLAHALLVNRLLAETGIESELRRGYTGFGERHIWNVVHVGGAWYNLDVLYRDVDYNLNQRQTGWFLVSDETLEKSGTRSLDEEQRPSAATDLYAGLHALSYTTVHELADLRTERFVVEPLYAKRQLFYVNDAQALVVSNQQTVKKLSDGPAFELTYADGAMYFLDDELLLYRYDLATKTLKQLLDEPANDIAIEGAELLAYDRSKIVLRVPITERAEQMTTLANTLTDDALDVDFVKLADQLLAAYAHMSLTEKALISADTEEKIELVKNQLLQQSAFAELLSETPAYSAQKVTANALKTWTVTLSARLEESAMNESKVVIYDMLGNEVESQVSIDGKKIRVTPLQPYSEDIPYTLYIKKELKSVSGKELKNDLYVSFRLEL